MFEMEEKIFIIFQEQKVKALFIEKKT